MAYTTIDDPSAHFQVKIYTGTGSSNAITNDGNSDLQPDLMWGKARNQTYNQNVFDTSRGINKRLTSDQADAENTDSTTITAVGSDGFTLGTSSNLNGSSVTYVVWQWKANGGTTTTNDASATSVGTIDSVYQANTTAGFSIVTHTGSGSSGTIAHGLGAAIKWMVTKNRTDNSEDWANYHVGLPSAEYYIRTNTTAAQATGSSVWGDTAPTSTVFTVGGANGKNNASSKNYVSYCWAPIQGFSKFGSYTANNNADGVFVYTGFTPKIVVIKKATAAGEWHVLDTEREQDGNPIDKDLYWSGNYTEGGSAQYTDFLSNGFKLRNAHTGTNGENTSEKFLYIAFAEHPFVSSEGVPTTAR
jgi:hypothetical protein